jgi:hypothetical protein
LEHNVLTNNVSSDKRHVMRTRLLAGVFSALFVAGAPVAGVTVTPAHAQASISVEFRTALQDHGRWQRHSRWGDVWVPGNLARDWRPYTNGHWVYTDDWGWYWVEADAEANWGWVTNHYGRWVYDDELQWAWVPGEEWGPAWVEWRRSNNNDVVGWAALAPDDVVEEYRESPRYWVFVRSRDFVSPRIASVIVTEREYPVLFRETVVVNRTVVVRDRGPRFAVNPGIPAAYIAASVGRPLHAFEVRPRVLASTAGIRGAVVVREQDLRRGQNFRATTTVRETRTEIRPDRNVSAPRALSAGEQGRLGDNPPRAARAQQGPTDGRNRDDRQGAEDRNRNDRQGAQDRGRNANERQGAEDRNRNANERQGAEERNRNANERQGAQDRNRNANERQGAEDRNRNANDRQGTTGRGRGEERQQGAQDRNRNEPKQRPGTEGRGEPRQGAQERNRSEQQKQGAEDRNRGPERQQRGTEGRSNESRQRPGTDGLGSRDQRSNVQPRGPETRQQPAPQVRQQQPAPQQGRAQPQQQPQNVDRGGGDPRGARAQSPNPPAAGPSQQRGPGPGSGPSGQQRGAGQRERL